MMRHAAVAIVLLSIGMGQLTATARAGNWTQFRGENAAGLAVASGKLPAEIGPNQSVVWKIPLPPGHASPVVFGTRIFLNAVRDDKLLVVCLDRGDGKLIWETAVPHDRL